MRTSSSLSSREHPARRIGVILSILFLTSVGTVATMTSAHASAQEQAGTATAEALLPFSTGL